MKLIKTISVSILLLILVKADTLIDMVEYMTDKVGLVHQMPFTCDREGFAATFEKVGFSFVLLRPMGHN